MVEKLHVLCTMETVIVLLENAECNNSLLEQTWPGESSKPLTAVLNPALEVKKFFLFNLLKCFKIVPKTDPHIHHF